MASRATPADILVASLLLVTALVVTGVSYWITHLRSKPVGPTFLYLQALFDLALVTTVVHVTGGPDSDFAGLYVLVIGVSAVLMLIHTRRGRCFAIAAANAVGGVSGPRLIAFMPASAATIAASCDGIKYGSPAGAPPSATGARSGTFAVMLRSCAIA